MQVVIWAWGDDARKWTPNFAPLDGQNGSADRRLQRYIAARLGPLPGWSMGYGFDLEEWASEAEVQSWADYLHAQMGWDHLLWGRRRRNADLNAVSNDLRPDGNPADEFYQMAVAELNNSRGRPVIFERRFGYLRDGVWTAEKTRRAMWQFTMAGGAAGWFGFRAGSSITAPGPYPNPEQLQTHDAFWEDRLLTNMERHNELAPDSLAWALATPDLDNIVIYAQNTDHITLDLKRYRRAADGSGSRCERSLSGDSGRSVRCEYDPLGCALRLRLGAGNRRACPGTSIGRASVHWIGGAGCPVKTAVAQQVF